MMTRKHKETVRLTIDFPVNQHKYIKTLASIEGVTLKQFVIEHLPNLETKGKKKHKEASDEEFDSLLKEFLIEKAPMLKRLSKK